MLVDFAPIGRQSPHDAGRQLLAQMYRSRYSQPMPQIQVTDRGKPYFENSPVYFSISHTAGHVFCVLAECPVGIDAEAVDRDIRLALSEKILSPTELALYEKAPDKRDTLLRFWVLKEAAAKCTGEGLKGYPNHTDFSPDDPRIQVIAGCYVAIIEEFTNI